MDHTSSSSDARPSPYSVSPLLAFFLTLLNPGIGLTYASADAKAGLLVLVGLHIATLLGLGLYSAMGFFVLLVLLCLGLFAVTLIVALYATVRARQVQPRKYVYGKLLAVVLVSIGLSTQLSTRSLVHIYKVRAYSMAPTILRGDYVLVNKFAYGPWNPWTSQKLYWTSTPQRGDLIAFHNPINPDQVYIKRVAALPGDTVSLRAGVLHVNDKPVPRRLLGPHTYRAWKKDTGQPEVRKATLFRERLNGHTYRTLQDPISLPRWRNWSSRKDAPQNTRPWGPKVSPHHFFVLGDNRDRSADSRDWGLVPQRNIIGKVTHVTFSYPHRLAWERIGLPLP